MFRLINSFLLFSFISLSMSVVSINASTSEQIPDDIRYMLEDLYGANKSEWPKTRTTDLNKDGFTDWVARKENCTGKDKCPIEIFVCVPNEKRVCSEYCYIEVKTLKNIAENLKTLKCESTC